MDLKSCEPIFLKFYVMFCQVSDYTALPLTRGLQPKNPKLTNLFLQSTNFSLYVQKMVLLYLQYNGIIGQILYLLIWNIEDKTKCRPKDMVITKNHSTKNRKKTPKF